ncbi:MAG: Tim44-like domain-containing protein [Pseudomonadota bacterium]|nr:Tim44-like domain-containing protein [Pseudomonadota bacterium]
MKSLIAIAAALLTATTFSLSLVGDAEAKRLGGGRSFGGKAPYSSPYKRATPAKPAAPSPAQQKNAGVRQSLSQRGGLMGMLGGLALGGLLGAMFFGGAFEGLNFVDILIFAAIAFVLYKLFASRRRASPSAAGLPGGAASSSIPAGSEGGAFRREAGARPFPGFNTDLLFKGNTGSAVSGTRPAGFDEMAFMQGAERAYRHLQEAWDQGDLEALRTLTTEPVFVELSAQISSRHGRNQTEILDLSSELLDVRDSGNQWEATVLFDVQMREVDEDNLLGTSPTRVREVWRFIRPATGEAPTWFLDGIQQVEE